MIQDFRLALRALRLRPGLTAIVVLTAGLAIGAATALFDLVNLVAWMPIPGTEPGRLVRVHNEYPQPAIGLYGSIPTGDVEVYRDQATSFEALASERWASLEVAPTADHNFASTTAEIRFVSGNYFSTLGAGTRWGRPIEPRDDEPAAPAVAVLSHRFFTTNLGGDQSLLGAPVLIGTETATVVGVAAEDFEVLVAGNTTDLWLADAVGPRHFEGYRDTPLVADTDVLARLKPGVTRAQAQAELSNLAQELDRASPLPTLDRKVTVIPARLSHAIDRRNFRPILSMLAAAVIALMLLACANIANILLGRSLERSREVSVRQALGAPRARLVRQLLAEYLVLGLLAGAVGLLFALVARRLFRLWDLQDFAALMQFDHRVLVASTLTCLVAVLAFGLLPALIASRTDLVNGLKEDTRPLGKSSLGSSGLGGSSLSAFSVLAGLQAALATVLLVSVGAIAFHIASLQKADLGFDQRGLVRASIFFQPFGYTKHQAQKFMVQLESRAEQMPMVTSTTRSLFLPPVYLEIERTFALADEPDHQRRSRLNVVDDGYFSTLRIPLLAGRTFDSRETDGPPTAIVNELFASTVWPELDIEEVLGQTLLLEQRRPDDPKPEHRIVGVVSTITQHDLNSQGEAILYLPIDQRPRPSLALVARVEGDIALYAEQLRAAIQDIDPKVQPGPIQGPEERMWDALVVQRLQSQSVAILALIGTGLSLLGMFGVTRLAVQRRRREIALRMAVGANSNSIKATILGHSTRICLTGILVGIAVAVAANRLLRALVEGLGAAPWWVYALAAVLLLLATLVASYPPTRRATQIEPARVLRGD